MLAYSISYIRCFIPKSVFEAAIKVKTKNKIELDPETHEAVNVKGEKNPALDVLWVGCHPTWVPLGTWKGLNV